LFRAFRDSALTRLPKGQARSVKNAALAARASAVFPSDNQRRRVGPLQVGHIGLRAAVDSTEAPPKFDRCFEFAVLRWRLCRSPLLPVTEHVGDDEADQDAVSPWGKTT
jgi:hypothetical protein